MARATDEIYVKIIAETQNATKGMAGFADSLKGSLEPIKKLSRALNELFVVGGAALIFQRIVRGLGEMQMAYEKLNPAAAKAAGSLTNWRLAMEAVKARTGGMVESTLNPIREFFINLIDPVVLATQHMKEFNDAAATTFAKFATSGQLALKKHNEALVEQVRLQKELTDAMARQKGLEQAYNAAREALDKLPGINAFSSSRSVNQNIAAKTAVETAREAFMANIAVMENAKQLLKAIQLYLASESATGGGGTVAGVNQLSSRYGMPFRGKGASGSTIPGLPPAEEVQKTAAAVALINDDFEEMAQRAALVGHEWEGFDEIVQSNLATFVAMAGVWASMSESIVSGDVAGAFAKLGQAALAELTKMALLAAATAAGFAHWGEMAFWLGVAGISIFGSAELGTLHSDSASTPTAPGGPVQNVSKGGTTIIVQGSVWQTQDLARAVAGAMGNW